MNAPFNSDPGDGDASPRSGSQTVVIVSGMSGGGKASVLRALEDVGYDAVDNPPLPMLEEMVARQGERLAIGIDARTRGFDAAAVEEAITRLRTDPDRRVELVYAWADETTLLRRFAETRRRHPLVPQGRVTDGIAAERVLTAELRAHADLVLDTSDLPLAGLRRLIEQHFGSESGAGQACMVVSLISFAYPRGLPPEADLVFDARFLRNPHYDPILRPGTGLDAAVAAYVEADPDFADYFSRVAELVELVLPRFVQEGKKYATITIGCTGGRHRSVHLVEKLANRLATCIPAAKDGPDGATPWRLHVTHRELAREGMPGGFLSERPVSAECPVASAKETDLDKAMRSLTAHPQEAYSNTMHKPEDRGPTGPDSLQDASVRS